MSDEFKGFEWCKAGFNKLEVEWNSPLTVGCLVYDNQETAHEQCVRLK